VIRLLVRLGATAAIAILLLGAAPAYGRLTAPQRVSPALERELSDGSPVYAVSVELPFQPEYYHVHRLQQIGTVAGVQGRQVRVLQLSADQVREIASFYWVERVDVLAGTAARASPS
jgi:hypothetical protein